MFQSPELRREMENKGPQEMIPQNPRCWKDEGINEFADEKRAHFKQVEDREERHKVLK